MQAGGHGIACLGPEVAHLSIEECIDVMTWAVQDRSGSGPPAVTITGKTVDEQTAQVKAAEECGANWLILQPPFGQKPAEAELMTFYRQVMAQTTLPIGIENAPEYLGGNAKLIGCCMGMALPGLPASTLQQQLCAGFFNPVD